MTLLMTVIAALICTVIWYISSRARELGLGTLCLIYWGASLMWTVDAVAEYIEQEESYFTPAAADMLNDAFLGLSAAALGMLIWVIHLLVKDPKGVVKNAISGLKK